jgi:metallopeptidase MepB
MILAKYQKPPQAPPNFNATPESLEADTEKLFEKTRGLIDKIATEIKAEDAKFENVVLPIARNWDIFRLASYIINFYQEVSISANLRQASSKAAKMIDDFDREFFMREDIYRLVEAIFEKGEELDLESERLLERNREDYIQNGLGLPAGPLRDRFKKIKKDLDREISDFQTNLYEENGGI